MKKRGFWFGLALCLALCLLPGTALAASSTGTLQGGLVTWELNNGKLTVSGKGAIPDMPESLPPDADPNSEEARWVALRSQITSVEIQPGINSVGNYAFYGCTRLGSLTFPLKLASIGEFAFAGCTNLGGTVTLRDGLGSIGGSAFFGCSKLTGITIPSSVHTVGPAAFQNTGLKDVLLPGSVSHIGDGAFDGCANLSAIHYWGSWTGDYRPVRPNGSEISFHYLDPNLPENVSYQVWIEEKRTCNDDIDSTRTTWVRCPTCGGQFTQREILEKLPHVWENKDAVAPTCETPGQTAGIQCRNEDCLKIRQGMAAVPALGHDYGEPVEMGEPPSCTETTHSKLVRTCKNNPSHQEVVEKDVPPTGHQWETLIEAKAPTCTSDGCTAEVKCSQCNLYQSHSVTLPSLGGHQVEEETEILREGTCQQEGQRIIRQTCTVCGEILDEHSESYYGAHVIRKDSNYKEEITIQPTCGQPGDKLITYVCPVCGQTDSLWEYGVVPATGKHQEEVLEAVPATCISSGLTEGTFCILCGETLVEQEYIDIDPDAHDPGDPWYSEEVDATCESDGSRVVNITCNTCHEIISSEKEILPGGHKPVEGSETEESQPATCTEDGFEATTAVCERCGETYDISREVLKATGHTLKEGSEKETILQEATCTEDGEKVQSAVCETCGQTYPIGKPEKIPAGHIPKAGSEQETITKPATCTEDGEKVKTAVCERCGQTYPIGEPETIPGGHKMGDPAEPEVTKEPTCTESGTQVIKSVCSVCGKAYTKVQTIPAKGHTFGEWTVVKEATETEPGSRERVCSVCQEKETEAIPAAGDPDNPDDPNNPDDPPPTGTFTITFNANGGALSGSASATTGTDGKLSSLPANPTRSGYTFAGWYTAAEGGTPVTTSTVFEKNATVYAHWTSSGGSAQSHVIRLNDSGNGAVSSSVSSAVAGATVTLYVDPDSGYRLSSLRVSDSGGARVSLSQHSDSRYTFIMPDSWVEVTASFTWSSSSGGSSSGAVWNTTPSTTVDSTPAPVVKTVPKINAYGQTFYDIPASHWAAGEIAWAYQNGYMNGTGGGAFTPDRAISHQQLWTVLTRLLGSTRVSESGLQSIRAGLIDGGNPAAPTTRQEMVTALYRCAFLMGGARGPSGNLNRYSDSRLVSGFARDAMAWAVTNGIISGTADGRLNPGGTVTRAQFAVILYRFSQRA